MGPFDPEAIFHGIGGSFAVVQPQEVRTLFTEISDGDVLVSQNVNRDSASPGLAEYSFVSESHLIRLMSPAAVGAIAVAASGEGTATAGDTLGGAAGAGEATGAIGAAG